MEKTDTAIKPIVAELVPKEQNQLTKEEREIQKLRGRLYGICNKSVDYLETVIDGAKGNRTRMKACSEFIKFLPALDQQVGTQPLHLHLSVPRPKAKELKPESS